MHCNRFYNHFTSLTMFYSLRNIIRFLLLRFCLLFAVKTNVNWRLLFDRMNFDTFYFTETILIRHHWFLQKLIQVKDWSFSKRLLWVIYNTWIFHNWINLSLCKRKHLFQSRIQCWALVNIFNWHGLRGELSSNVLPFCISIS